MSRFALTITLFALSTAPVAAEVLAVGSARAPEVPIAAVAPPLRVAEELGAVPFASLSEARAGVADAVAAVTAWNASGQRPLRNGVVRILPLPQTVRFTARLAEQGAGLSAGGVFVRSGERLTWGAAVEVAQAHRLRLHLDAVDLPATARLWVIGSQGDVAGPFGRELLDETGGLWTPSVSGPTARLEVELPTAATGATKAPGFTVDRVLEVLRLNDRGAPVWSDGTRGGSVDDSCLLDATCFSSSTFPGIADARKAVGQMQFVIGGFGVVCTGSLLNDTDGATFIPYFLTANHCLDTQSVVNSLEVFWDYKTTSCGGSFPNENGLPRSMGGTLLATHPSSDFTLLRLTNIPSGRSLLGWNAGTNILTPSTRLHRLSHPLPNDDIYPQSYTEYRPIAPRFSCGEDNEGRDFDDTTKFQRTRAMQGGSFGGSSGSPLMLDSGQVVGQLLGACGTDPEDGCDDDNNDTMDGQFSNTFPFIRQFLAPDVNGDPPPPSSTWLTTTSVPGFRFQVRITGSSVVLGKKENDCIPETLCVSGAIAGRSEVFLRVVGPRGNGFLWPTLVKFTTSQVEIWIEQLSTGQRQYYLLEGASPDVDELPGLFDRMGFQP